MLNEVCAYLHNYFDVNDDHEVIGSLKGEFEIKDGGIDLSGLVRDGQYFRIQNSLFNDGVHKYPAEGLTDEVFRGKVTAMAVPNELIGIVSEIEKWMEKYGSYSSHAKSPYNSESFAGYSYSKSSGGSGSDGGGTAPEWAASFGGRLARWRKI